MYKPQNAIEQKLIEFIFESKVYRKSFPTHSKGYTASIERDGERTWDEQGRLKAILDINPVKNENHPWPNLLDGGAFPIYLSVERIDEDEFIGGVLIDWEMPANAWGLEQSNRLPSTPYLKKPDEEDTAILTDRYEIRMEPELKQWMIEQGGAAFIRSLLRTERERQQEQL